MRFIVRDVTGRMERTTVVTADSHDHAADMAKRHWKDVADVVTECIHATETEWKHLPSVATPVVHHLRPRVVAAVRRWFS